MPIHFVSLFNTTKYFEKKGLKSTELVQKLFKSSLYKLLQWSLYKNTY